MSEFMSEKNNMRTWQGQGVSEGIGIGRIRWIGPQPGADWVGNQGTDSTPERERNRFHRGLRAYRARLDSWLALARQESDQTKADVLNFYGEMADDPDFCDEAEALMVDSRLSASQAVRDTLNRTIEDMERLDDVRLRERAADVRAFRDQLIAAMEQETSNGAERLKLSQAESASDGLVPEREILVGAEISPVDLAALNLSNVCGIVSAQSGPTSHLAILAQSLEIPAVVAVPDSAAFLTEIQGINIQGSNGGALLILDGLHGEIVANPTAERLQADRDRQKRYQACQADRDWVLSAPNQSADGRPFELRANIVLPSDIPAVLKYGAHGVGVLRSEFILGWSSGFAQSGGIPTEDEQFAIYRRMVEDLKGAPLTVRTFDVGGDKPLPGLVIPAEANPFLGLRGCRLYDLYPDVLLDQIRAILRAAAFGPVEILFPMITSIEEAQDCLKFMERAKERLTAAGKPFGMLRGTGLMIETPAAALIAEELAPLADFLSIGTNDLTQYTLAADRGNPVAANRYRSDHPAVLRLIQQTIDAGRRFGKRVCVCGELAGDPEIARTLLDMGLDEWSMTPARIPAVKRRLIG